MKKNKIVIMFLIASMATSALTGCGAKAEDAKNLFNGKTTKVQNYASSKEVTDFYAKQMQYGDIANKPGVDALSTPVKDHKIDTDSQVYAQITKQLPEVILEHNKNFNYFMPQGIHDYIKNFTDNMSLNNAKLQRVDEYGGYYYATVEFDVVPNVHGSFKNQANYLGIDGIIVKDEYDNEYIDKDYLKALINKVKTSDRIVKTVDENGNETETFKAVNLVNFEDDPNTAYSPELTKFGQTLTDQGLTESKSTEQQTAEAQTQDENQTGTAISEAAAAKGDNTEETSEASEEETKAENESESTESTEETTEATETTETTEPAETEAPVDLSSPEFTGLGEGIQPLEVETVESSAPNTAKLLKYYYGNNHEELEKNGINNIDRLTWDADYINTTVGSSNEQIPFIPTINMVYNPADTLGQINGFGMYNEGKAGLSTYGFVPNDTSNPGKILVVFVFSQDITEPKKLSYDFSYVIDYKSNNNSIADANGVFGGSFESFMEQKRQDALKEAQNKEAKEIGNEPETLKEEALKEEFTGSQLTVSSFISDKLNLAVDEVDRAVQDSNISALMDGTIIEDAGLGIKYAAYAKSSDITTFSSKIIRIIARNKQDNSYLVEIERNIEDAPKDSGVVGQCRDTYFAVIRQDGEDFRYNDEFLYNRTVVERSYAEPENAIIRRLIALNLSGAVPSTAQVDINEQVFKYLSDQLVQRYSEFTNVFDSDTTLLSDERKEYFTSDLIDLANDKGADAKLEYIIKPSEWISGNENQVEVTTKEVMIYNDGEDGATYIENYYLLSNYNNKWVIDDVVNIKTQNIESEDVDTVKNNVNSTVATVTNADEAATDTN